MVRDIQKESNSYSNRLFCWLAIAFIAATLSHGFAIADQLEKKISWYIFDIKPTHFISGPEKGTGYADYAQARLIEGMTDYEHTIKVVSIARLVADLKAGKQFCVINGYYGGAPFPTAYTAPYNISRARHVIFLKKNRKKIIGQSSRPSFETLINNQKLVFGHMAGEPYHPKINKMIEDHKSEEHVFIRYDSTRMAEGLFEMLRRERIDYFLQVVEVFNHYINYIEKTDVYNAVLPVETVNFVELVAPNCTGGAWGDMVVKDMNKVLVKVRPTREFRAALEKWYVTPENKDEYRRLYEQEVLTRNEYRPGLELK